MGRGEGKGNNVDDNMILMPTVVVREVNDRYIVGYAESHDLELGLGQDCCPWRRRRGEAQGEGRGGYPWESF